MGDTFYSFFVIFVFLVLYIITVYIQTFLAFKKDYKQYKCNPLVIPFAGMFGENPTTVFNDCVMEQQKKQIKQYAKKTNATISKGSATTSSSMDINSGMVKSQSSSKDSIFGSPSNKKSSLGSSSSFSSGSSDSDDDSSGNNSMFGTSSNVAKNISIQNTKLAMASKNVMDVMMSNLKAISVSLESFPKMAESVVASTPVKIVKFVGL